MRLKNYLKNQSGIGLIEVMVAIAITGGLALTLAKLMDNAGQNAKQIEAKSENTNLKGLLQDILNNPTACANTFGVVMTPSNVTALSASATATVTVPSIKDKANTIKYSTASTNINPLTITSMELTNYNSTAFTGDLIVQSNFMKSSSMVMMVKPIRIPINFSFISGAFSSCSTMAVGGEWLLGGNAGTVDGTDYIGTSDNTALNFRVNAQKAGRIDPLGPVFLGARSGFSNTANMNTGIGYYALNANTSGDANTALGYQSLLTNTTGAGNTAMGNGALRANTTVASNFAMGSGALYSNTTASSSTAIGDDALSSNTTASFNTALGAKSLTATTTGAENVAVGAIAMQSNSTGRYNTGIGAFAMGGNTTGSENTAVGRSVFARNTTGSYNALLGNYAGWFTTNGSFNTYIGHRAGYNHATGDNNIFIGYNSGTNVTASSNKLYMDTTSNATPLIGADFSTRQATIDGTMTLNGNSSVALKMNTGHAIRTKTGSSTDKIYIDTRTLFRDAATGGNGFVGIAGGLGIGSGSYWDGSVIPAQGDVQIQGTVGIGTQSPLHKLHVVGNIYTSGEIRTAGGTKGCPMGWWCNAYFWDVSTQGIYYTNINGTSDRRLKKNIKDLDETFVKRLLKLNPVQFEWRKDKKTGRESKGIHYGFIAQEVEAVWPELVSTSSDEMKTKSLSVVSLISPIIKAFQFMNEELVKNKAMLKVMQTGLEERLDQQEKTISILENKVNILQKENQDLKDRLDRIEKILAQPNKSK